MWSAVGVASVMVLIALVSERTRIERKSAARTHAAEAAAQRDLATLRQWVH